MDFRIKCAMQHAFSVLPGGRQMNYLMQRYVSRSFPISEARLAEYRRLADKHLRHAGHRVFEFGAGSTLAMALLFAKAGREVTATDIAENARRELVEDVADRIGIPASSVDYLVCDTSNTGLPAGSFDLITSTSVLEHVPAEDIPAILAECRRLLSPQGECSFCVDYTDHWAHFDGRISRLNFLRYDARTWALYNPPLQYQNRLRHSDYIGLFENAGFRITDIEIEDVDAPTFPVARDFASYGERDLRAALGWFTLAHT